MTQDGVGRSPRTLADKLDYLFRPPGRRPYTVDEVSEGIRDLGGSASRANLNALRLGRITNPRRSTVEALAMFFEVSVSYLLDDPYPAITSEEHELLSMLRRTDIADLVRAVHELGPETGASLVRIAEELRRVQGRDGDHRST